MERFGPIEWTKVLFIEQEQIQSEGAVTNVQESKTKSALSLFQFPNRCCISGDIEPPGKSEINSFTVKFYFIFKYTAVKLFKCASHFLSGVDLTCFFKVSR